MNTASEESLIGVHGIAEGCTLNWSQMGKVAVLGGDESYERTHRRYFPFFAACSPSRPFWGCLANAMFVV
jgi:hypothetical protein